MTPQPVTIGEADPTSDRCRALLRAYAEEICRRCDVPPGPWTRFAVVVEGECAPPGGIFLLATLGGVPAGCAGLRTLSPGVVELKRMFVAPEGRGRGVGRALLERLIAEARGRGATRIVLDTRPELIEATALYRGAGFQPIAPYNDSRDAGLWFELLLPSGDVA